MFRNQPGSTVKISLWVSNVDLLSPDWYVQDDVVQLARELIGKELFTIVNGQFTSGIITETEAYNGTTDKACHAYGNKRTSRTEVMYRQGGVAYVYLCYGIHELFNVVTGLNDNPQAILIRKIIPYRGINIMEQRRNMKIKCTNFSSGPGTTSKALSITRDFNGIVLNGSTIGIANLTFNVPDDLINVTPRIGVEYAGNDALLPYRFVVNNKDLESFLSMD